MATLPAATAAYRYDTVADPTYPGLTAELDHAALDNLNSTNYTHLTAANHTDLTDGGASTLHYHAADRDSANWTGTNATDLTDGGNTTLHTHDSKANVAQEAWTDVNASGGSAPAFVNSWVNHSAGYDNLGYMLDTLGFVHLRGVIKSGSGQICSALPSAYRPGKAQELPAASYNGSAWVVAEITILAAGTVVMSAGHNNLLSLDGITYRPG